MSINAKHPEYIEFLTNELKTLKILMDNSYIKSNLSSLQNSASQTYYKYKAIKSQTLKNQIFDFHCVLDLYIERKLKKVVVEAKIIPDFSFATYVLAICKLESSYCSLIRKFHFDYAPPITGQNKKPVYHLQYGGKLSPKLKEMVISVDQLNPWLSAPRINSTPINLALLLDMVFSEFVSEITHCIKERSEWRELIKNDEDFILKPFYKGVDHFLNSEHSSNYLLKDFYYGR